MMPLAHGIQQGWFISQVFYNGWQVSFGRKLEDRIDAGYFGGDLPTPVLCFRAGYIPTHRRISTLRVWSDQAGSRTIEKSGWM